MTRHLRLVTDDVSHDTIDATKRLHDDARAGKMVGIAFVGVYQRGTYIHNTAGYCYREPGMMIVPVRSLDEYLWNLVKVGHAR